MRLKKLVVPCMLDDTPLPKSLTHVHGFAELGSILRQCLSAELGHSKSPSRATQPSEADSAKSEIAVRQSSQRFLGRSRRPRVHIEYEVELSHNESSDARRFVELVFQGYSS